MCGEQSGSGSPWKFVEAMEAKERELRKKLSHTLAQGDRWNYLQVTATCFESFVECCVVCCVMSCCIVPCIFFVASVQCSRVLISL